VAVSSFVRELRRRHVLRSAGLYIVGTWALLQVLDLAFESFAVPAAALRFVWITAIAAFPFALILFWRYDVTATGIRLTPPANADDEVDLTLGGADYAILAGLAAIAVTIVVGTMSRVSDEIVAPTQPWYDGGAGIERIVVLPFEDLSVDDNQRYLAAGFHDTLIATLSRIPRFRVTSRFSSMRLGRDASLDDIRERVGADRVLTGSFARDGELARVNVSMLDVESGETLWTESYTRELDGLLDVQREVASSVAREVSLTLTPEQESRLAVRDKPDEKTYEAYLKGMIALRRGSPRAYRRAINILTEAVEDAPTSALAYAGLGIAYAKLGHSPFPVDGVYPRAKEASLRAIELDPDLSDAWVAVGMTRAYYEWDFEGAEEAYLRALELNPSQVDAHYHYAWLLELLKRDDEAIAHGEYSVELNQLSPFYAAWLAEQYRDAGRYEEAERLALTTLDLNPEYPTTLMVLGQVYIETDRPDEAIETHAQLGDNAFWGYTYAVTLALAGRRDEALAARAAMEEKSTSPYTDLLLYAGLGDVDRALKELDGAREMRYPFFPWMLNWFPQTKILRDHPTIETYASELEVPLDDPPAYAAK
jgi:TolB-like protein